jgi:glycosyltransferase involved in cell wall biosynthesis
MKFSVLISVYAKEKPAWFHRAMQSIWDDQTLKPNQIVLVKDGPLTPEIEEIVKYWEKSLGEFLTIVSLKENVGLGAALNAGLKYCRYELIARMDSDDISLPQRFEKQVSTFKENQDVDVLGTFGIEIDDYGNYGQLNKRPITHELIIENLWACPFIHVSVMMKRNKLINIGAYNSKLKRRQDYELWFRMAKYGIKFANIPECLILFRLTRDTHKKQPIRVALEQAMIGYNGVKMLKMGRWKQLACFFPFFRSFFPSKVQHFIYTKARRFDPRLRN